MNVPFVNSCAFESILSGVGSGVLNVVLYVICSHLYRRVVFS